MESNSKFKQISFYSEIFIRCICLIFIFVFIDSIFQCNYLIGENGVSPVGENLQRVKDCYGNWTFFKSPGLFWISTSNVFIYAVFLIGIVSSFFAFLGIGVVVNLLIVFICWLSVINGGGDFFIYVWDTFLLEAGFIAFLIASINHKERFGKLVIFLLGLLVFRFWFSMGMEKLLYNNSLWMSGSYMKYYFANQPMPTKLAFYMGHFPLFVYQIISGIVLLIEIAMPILMLFRRTRIIAFFAFCGLSILIQIFGNYAWFNLLTIVVCIPLLIGTSFGKKLIQRKRIISLGRRLNIALPEKLVLPVIYYQVFLQFMFLIMLFFPLGNRYLNFLNYYSYRTEFNSWSQKNVMTKIISIPLRVGADFKIANPYGVFKGIAVKRWELVFELKKDSISDESNPLIYRYKPGLSDHMGIFAPHFPRLEQQLFYEAQQGSFYIHYTPNSTCSVGKCWTANFTQMLLKGFNYQYILTEDAGYVYNFIKISVVQLSFNSWEDYRHSGRIWTQNTVFSFILDKNFLNCPLIDPQYYITFRKHIQ